MLFDLGCMSLQIAMEGPQGSPFLLVSIEQRALEISRQHQITGRREEYRLPSPGRKPQTFCLISTAVTGPTITVTECSRQSTNSRIKIRHPETKLHETIKP